MKKSLAVNGISTGDYDESNVIYLDEACFFLNEVCFLNIDTLLAYVSFLYF